MKSAKCLGEISEKNGEASTTPFYHRVIDNFLPEDTLKEVIERHRETEFYEKHSDLFHFLQSNELKNEKQFSSFLGLVRNEMQKDLSYLNKKVEEEEMDLFASIYDPGHYLLPHDDCITQRVLAFSFYLNSPLEEAENVENSGNTHSKENGHLALYDKDGRTVVRRVEPVANRLVIFEVSSRSYHEVEMMRIGRRAALTGWLRAKNYNPQTIELNYITNKYWIFHFEYAISIDLKPSHPELSSIKECNTKEYIAKAKKELDKLEWRKRLNCMYGSLEEPAEEDAEIVKIPLDVTIVQGDIQDMLVAKVKKGAYMLLNDPFNDASDALAILSLYNGTINVVNDSGILVGTIDKPGYYIWPASGNIFIPPSDSAGYFIAYRINTHKQEDE